MSRKQNINVKLPVHKVVAALEAALVKAKASRERDAAIVQENMKATEEWEAAVFAVAAANFDKAMNKRFYDRTHNGTVNLDFDLPSSLVPKRPEPKSIEYTESCWDTEIEELENTIRILKLTEDETISTSTYNAISKYL